MDVGLIIGQAGTFLAAGGLIFTAISFRAGEKWKRTEFARQLVDKLSTDDELAFCARALDWGVGPLMIPAKHRPLFWRNPVIMQHHLGVLRDSIQPELGEDWNKPEALTYRHSFDAFFTYLERVVDHIRSRIITRKQLVGLDYYLELVADPPYLRPKQDGEEISESAFRPFVENYYPALLPFIWPEARPRGWILRLARRLRTLAQRSRRRASGGSRGRTAPRSPRVKARRTPRRRP